MKKLSRLERYHLNKVSQRNPEKVVAVTPEAMEIENLAIERERREISTGNLLTPFSLTSATVLRCSYF